MIDALNRFLKGTTTVTCLAAGWALLLLSLVITINVVLRKSFDYSIQGVDEYGGYCLAISSALGFSLALYDKAHIRVTIVTDYLPVPARAVSNFLALTVLLIVAVTLTSRALNVAITSHEMNAQAVSALGTRLDVPQGLWAAGLILFCLALFVQTIRAVRMLARRDWEAVNDAFGAEDVKEELKEELRDAQRRVR
ncbi:hypothetical protein CDEF62S_01843 [Castellaniella defragrans]